MEKLKVVRSFTFKSYVLNESKEFNINSHNGEFLFKSECHYYCEKFVLDYIKNNLTKVNNCKFAIYKISTLEDSNVKDMLIELIFVKDGKIHIG